MGKIGFSGIIAFGILSGLRVLCKRRCAFYHREATVFRRQ